MRRFLAVVLLLFAIGGAPHAQTEIEDLEAQLESARGTERVRLLNRLAGASQVNSPSESLEHAAAALQLAESLSDREGQARALNNLGIGHYFLAEYSQALEYYLRSLAVAEAMGDQDRIASALNNIGIIHFVWGEYDETLRYYSRVLEIRQDGGNPRGLAAAHNNFGNVYYATGRYEESLEYYADALLLYREIDDPRMVASTLNNIGQDYHKLGQMDEALGRLEEALEIEEQLDDKPGMAQSLNNLGLIYGDLGRVGESLEYLRRSLAVRREIGDRQGAAVCHQNMGQVYASSGDHRRALDHLDEALEIAREIQVKEIQRDVHRILAETHESMGNTERALDSYRRHQEIADELLDEQTSRQMAELRARFELERKDREIEVLRKNQELQRVVRNVFLGGSILLVLLVLLLYNRYRLKERANQEMRKANEALKLAQTERDKAARAELTHVSRLVTMGELATALAHELNQPLTAILSNAQATRRLVAVPEVDKKEVDEALGDIVNGAGRARDLIQRLRELVRRREITREPLQVNDVLSDIEPIVRADTDRHGVRLVLELGSDLPTVRGDRVHLQQVALNLVRNGTEAMAGAGTIEREITLSTRAGDEDGVVVEVQDSGPGADQDVLDRMFDPFFTTRTEGLGMGLTICSSIIEAHGGRLWAEPNPDRGLTVRFTVPGSSPRENSA